MTGIILLGATGSIGKNTLEVIAQYPEKYQLIGASAYQNVDRMLEICQQFKPDYVVMVEKNSAQRLKELLQIQKSPITVFSGEPFLNTLVELPQGHCIVAGITGSAGIKPTFRAVELGKKILLANKEVMVMAGSLVMQTAEKTGATIIPIDSEHSAIFQCLSPMTSDSLHQVILTASGGPFLHLPLDQFNKITPKEACAHPNWSMGQKISVDSATLMNKSFEMIEASYLFNLNSNQLQALIHPQSIIHALIEYQDGSMISQLSIPDMRIPIAYGLSFPQRLTLNGTKLSLAQLKSLEFADIDHQRFPAFKMGLEAFNEGESYGIALNAANEVAVEAFIQEKISFNQITSIISKTLEAHQKEDIISIEQVIEIDVLNRNYAKNLLKISTMAS